MKRLLILAALIWPVLLSAQHTFSIVAVDTLTGEVGSAGATCLTSSDCGGCGGAVIISALTPGKGAINAQATVCIPNANANSGNNRINIGDDAPTVLNYLLTNDFCQFGDTSNRQYGIVTINPQTLKPAVAGFTGSGTMSYANHIVGPNYAVQGNILLGQGILDSMEAGFLNTQGDLCHKLMAALQGANVPGADTRCLPDSLSSKSSFIRVARPGDIFGPLLDLKVESTVGGTDPIDSLQTLFDQWKLANGLEATPEPGLRIYPNPGEGQVRIVLPRNEFGAYRTEVLDQQGRLLLSRNSEAVGGAIDLDAGDLPAGLYLLRVGRPGSGPAHSAKLLIR